MGNNRLITVDRLKDFYSKLRTVYYNKSEVDEKLLAIPGVKTNTFTFDHIVDSDETLLEWANCTDGSMKKVLVKSGTYTLPDNSNIKLHVAGTKYVFAEPDNKVVFNFIKSTMHVAIANGTSISETVIDGLNVELNTDTDCSVFQHCTNLNNCKAEVISTNRQNTLGCYAFNECTSLTNCKGTVTNATNGYAFKKCTSLTNCEGTATNATNGYGFYNCSYCSCCKSGDTASTTATFYGGSKIDPNTCDV